MSSQAMTIREFSRSTLPRAAYSSSLYTLPVGLDGAFSSSSRVREVMAERSMRGVIL